MAYPTLDIVADREYQSREFCKSVECPVQTELDSYRKGDARYDAVKAFCKDGCNYSRPEFIAWLHGNYYRIEGLDRENVCLSMTAWEFHDWLRRNGAKIVKKRNGK